MKKQLELKIFMILSELKNSGIQNYYLENALKKVSKLKLNIPEEKQIRQYLIKNEMMIFGLS